MATRPPRAIAKIFDLVDPHFRTVKNGGIVGDLAHVRTGGYHISREDLIRHGHSLDYSLRYIGDRRGPSNMAAALDLTFGDVKELITMSKRVISACKKNDPRVRGLREYAGTVDGKNVCGYNRVSSGNGSRSRVGLVSSGYSDKSHLWHGHFSIIREFVNNSNLMIGLAEVIAGVAPGTFGWTKNGEPDEKWDGKSFPGAEAFYIGVRADYVTLLGKRLVVHGWNGYSEGPGPEFTETDRKGVRWFQEKQGWTGSGADGFPGKLTWALLMSDPTPIVVPPKKADGTPPVAPPKVEPLTPKDGPGIEEFIGVSFNAAWEGFASTREKLKDWDDRLPILVDKVAEAKPVVIQTQEMGEKEAAQFYSRLEKKLDRPISYQRFGPLNTVGWDSGVFDYVKTIEIDTPDYGQYPGRGYCEAWLKDKAGNRLRLGSGHNPVKTSDDNKFQTETIEMIVTRVNNEVDDWPLIWGEDANSDEKKNPKMWALLKKYGYTWITNGVDAVFANFGAKVTKKSVVNLGDGSDHDMIVYKARTTKP